MAWRIVRQPSGLYARFADPVDDFTHYDMTRVEVLRFCIDELGLSAGVDKVVSAEAFPERYQDELSRIEAAHGKQRREEIEKKTH